VHSYMPNRLHWQDPMERDRINGDSVRAQEEASNHRLRRFYIATCRSFTHFLNGLPAGWWFQYMGVYTIETGDYSWSWRLRECGDGGVDGFVFSCWVRRARGRSAWRDRACARTAQTRRRQMGR
jgi:hypothetical protein